MQLELPMLRLLMWECGAYEDLGRAPARMHTDGGRIAAGRSASLSVAFLRDVDWNSPAD
jgi:hypothetical protein